MNTGVSRSKIFGVGEYPSGTFRFKNIDGSFWNGETFRFADYTSGESVLNYPKQHYNNGVAKNRTTRKRYKCLVRIIKNLKVKMAEDGYYVNENVSSFLLESLVYNFPNSKFLYDEDIYDWNDIIRSFIISFWNGSKEDKNDWKTWTEVSGLLPLMSNHKWKREDVHEFMLKLWNYLQYSTK